MDVLGKQSALWNESVRLANKPRVLVRTSIDMLKTVLSRQVIWHWIPFFMALPLDLGEAVLDAECSLSEATSGIFKVKKTSSKQPSLRAPSQPTQLGRLSQTTWPYANFGKTYKAVQRTNQNWIFYRSFECWLAKPRCLYIFPPR